MLLSFSARFMSFTGVICYACVNLSVATLLVWDAALFGCGRSTLGFLSESLLARLEPLHNYKVRMQCEQAMPSSLFAECEPQTCITFVMESRFLHE